MKTSKCILIAIAVSLVTIVIALAVGFVVLFFGFGRGQEYTPQLVEHKARLGMTIPQTEYALGEPPGAFKKWTAKESDGKTYVLVSEPGMASLFSVQHEIRLQYDSEGRLEAGYATYYVPFKESIMALELRPAKK